MTMMTAATKAAEAKAKAAGMATQDHSAVATCPLDAKITVTGVTTVPPVVAVVKVVAKAVAMAAGSATLKDTRKQPAEATSRPAAQTVEAMKKVGTIIGRLLAIVAETAAARRAKAKATAAGSATPAAMLTQPAAAGNTANKGML